MFVIVNIPFALWTAASCIHFLPQSSWCDCSVSGPIWMNFVLMMFSRGQSMNQTNWLKFSFHFPYRRSSLESLWMHKSIFLSLELISRERLICWPEYVSVLRLKMHLPRILLSGWAGQTVTGSRISFWTDSRN